MRLTSFILLAALFAVPSYADAPGAAHGNAASVAGDASQQQAMKAALLSKKADDAEKEGDDSKSKMLEAMAMAAMAQSKSDDKNEKDNKKGEEQAKKDDEKKKEAEKAAAAAYEPIKAPTNTYSTTLATDEEYAAKEDKNSQSAQNARNGSQDQEPKDQFAVSWDQMSQSGEPKREQLVDLNAGVAFTVGPVAPLGTQPTATASQTATFDSRAARSGTSGKSEPIPFAGALPSEAPKLAAIGNYAPLAALAAGSGASSGSGSGGGSSSGSTLGAVGASPASGTTAASATGSDGRREGGGHGGGGGGSAGSPYLSAGGSSPTAGTITQGFGAAPVERGPASTPNNAFSFQGADGPTARDPNGANVFEYASLRFRLLAQRDSRVRTQRTLAQPK